jgi:hypothetical protein
MVDASVKVFNTMRDPDEATKEIDLRGRIFESVLPSLPPRTPERFDLRREEIETERRDLCDFR